MGEAYSGFARYIVASSRIVAQLEDAVWFEVKRDVSIMATCSPARRAGICEETARVELILVVVEGVYGWSIDQMPMHWSSYCGSDDRANGCISRRVWFILAFSLTQLRYALPRAAILSKPRLAVVRKRVVRPSQVVCLTSINSPDAAVAMVSVENTVGRVVRRAVHCQEHSNL